MVFRCYAAVAHESLGENMTRAEISDNPIRNEALDTEQQKSASVLLYHLLVSLCRDQHALVGDWHRRDTVYALVSYSSWMMVLTQLIIPGFHHQGFDVMLLILLVYRR